MTTTAPTSSRALYGVGATAPPYLPTEYLKSPRARLGTATVGSPSTRYSMRSPSYGQPISSGNRITSSSRSSRSTTPTRTANDVKPPSAPEAPRDSGNASSPHGVEYNAGAPEASTEYIVDKKGGQTYIKGRLLGKGGFARCYKFKHVSSKHVCAGKCVEKSSLKKERARRKLLSEIKIHRSLSHTNVVRFEHFFEDKHFVYILLEYCNNQTLMELVKRKRRLSETHARTVMLQLLDGVEYLHSVNVIHRDLKLGNIFLTDGLQVRIGDFGLAARLDHKDEKKKTMCGTPNYLAPEILDGSLGHSFEVDIWSLGVILYTMLVGKPPFETKNVKQTYKRIQANLYTFPSEIPLTAEAKDLVRGILNKDPKMRPSLAKIRAHPFFAGYVLSQASPSAGIHAVREDKENAALPGNRVAASLPASASPRASEFGLGPSYPKSSSAPSAARQSPLDARKLTPSSKQPSSSWRSPTGYTSSPSPSPNPKSGSDDSVPLVVQKWVDYTSKYGLGYILQGGLVGVYFNDATKLIVAPNRYDFQYYERGSPKFAAHNLEVYPEALHKKVTLVKHFRNYLENDQEGKDPDAVSTTAAAEAMAASANGRSVNRYLAEFDDPSVQLPFVKKWVRTRHAIFFRLSNRTVQVAFFDDTQILLSAQAKRLTYFDKSRTAHTLPIEDAKQDPEISKRLRYTKDVLHRLIASSTSPPAPSSAKKSSP